MTKREKRAMVHLVIDNEELKEENVELRERMDSIENSILMITGGSVGKKIPLAAMSVSDIIEQAEMGSDNIYANVNDDGINTVAIRVNHDEKQMTFNKAYIV